MKKIRKFIVKYFALSYRVKLFGKEYAWLRASNIIFPLFCLFTLSVTYDLLIPLTSLLFGLSVFFGFFYFIFFPVKRSELDAEQKYFFDTYYKSIDSNNIPVYNNKFRILIVFINIIVGIITAILFSI